MSGYTSEGIVAFSNLEEHEEYQGQSTGKYSLVVTFEAEEAQKLEELGVRLREYEDKVQRKFTTKKPIQAIDLDNVPVPGELPYGTRVRIWWDGWEQNNWGVVPYMNGIRVLELAPEREDDQGPPEEF
jgi:hypothetical protein